MERVGANRSILGYCDVYRPRKLNDGTGSEEGYRPRRSWTLATFCAARGSFSRILRPRERETKSVALASVWWHERRARRARERQTAWKRRRTGSCGMTSIATYRIDTIVAREKKIKRMRRKKRERDAIQTHNRRRIVVKAGTESLRRKMDPSSTHRRTRKTDGRTGLQLRDTGTTQLDRATRTTYARPIPTITIVVAFSRVACVLGYARETWSRGIGARPANRRRRRDNFEPATRVWGDGRLFQLLFRKSRKKPFVKRRFFFSLIV